MSSDLLVEDRDAVRILMINRPARRNALTPDTVDELRAQVQEADSSIGALVLTGAGGHFSAGGDAGAILDVIAEDSGQALISFMRRFHGLVEAIWSSDRPVIAAVSGIAYGGGFNLALACDHVVCSADARFCQVFLRRGLIPDLGGTYLLPRLVGVLRAKELMLRTTELDAAQARELGLVNAVAADPSAALEAAVSVAAELAAGPRLAIALTKQMINSSMTGTLESSLEREALAQAAALQAGPARAQFEAFLR
jgi:2-(1,2-epoxy-1,2-dihydrophenyl)acetyl-CoA isomerase